jgi:D-glycero-D-manno-heptose 1,7-bisphosphate phosphatase
MTIPRVARSRDSSPDRRDGGRPCVFLDRDGTVTREAGYVNHPDRIELLPGAAAAIRRLNERGVLAVLTTNQAGVARGYLTEAVLKKVHRRLQDLLAERRARLDAIYYSPCHPDGSVAPYNREDPMRKPATGMIDAARRRFAIDMSRAYVVGDKMADIELARNAGITSVFVLTGYGLGEYEFRRRQWKHQPDRIAEDLKAAVAWIIKDLHRRGEGR